MASTDADLMRALHDDHAGALWSYVLSLVNGDASRAQDVVQETLLRAWQRPQILDQSDRSARAWLFTVAKRIVIDGWRSSRTRPETLVAETPEQAVSDDADRAADSAVVTAALRTLSAAHREVLLECYFRGAPVSEAATRLGISPGTVKSRTHYALRAFKLALEEMGGL